jgi:tetratricopeptide (TPR) repeat protein
LCHAGSLQGSVFFVFFTLISMAKQQKKEKHPVQEEKKKPETGKGRSWLFPALIFIFSIVLYSNTIDHGYVMDDGAMISDNATTKMGYAGMKQFFKESSVYGATKEKYGTYRPLTMATYAFELGMAGFKQDVPGVVKDPNEVKPEFPVLEMRVVHIFLYALCCVILFFALEKLLKSYHPLIPFISVMLFAAHPLHTEVGAFIKSRDELLSMIFVFSSLYFLLRHFESKKTSHWVWSIVLFLLATFSKESSMTFLLIFPMCLYFFTDKKGGDIFRYSLPYLGCVLIYYAARNSVLEGNAGFMPPINNPLVEAHGIFGRLPVIMFVFLLNLKLLIWPNPLMWYYGYDQFPLKEYGWSNPWVLLSFAIHIALFVYAIRGLRQRNIFSFLVLFYLISISITSNLFVLISALMAERFLFVASLAFCIGIAYLLTKYLSPGNTLKIPPVLGIIVIGALGVFSYMTMERNKDWKDEYTLFKSAADLNDNSYRAHSTFAWLSYKTSQTEKDSVLKKQYLLDARRQFEIATSIWPKQQPDWFNLGTICNLLKDSVGAEKAFANAYKADPKQVNAAYNLGVIYYRRKNFTEAVRYWEDGASRDPYFENISFMLGITYQQYLNDPQKAIVHYEHWYQKAPNDRNVVNNLYYMYKAVGNTAKEKEFGDKLAKMPVK